MKGKDPFYDKSNSFLKARGESYKESYIRLIKQTPEFDVRSPDFHSYIRGTFASFIEASDYSQEKILNFIKTYIAALYIIYCDEDTKADQDHTSFFTELISDVKSVDPKVAGQVEETFSE